MADGGNVLGLVATGTLVNALSAVTEGKKEASFGIVFGGIALFGSLAALGQFYDWRLARNFAWLFLLGTILFRGESFFTWINKALASSGASPLPADKTDVKAARKGN